MPLHSTDLDFQPPDPAPAHQRAKPLAVERQLIGHLEALQAGVIDRIVASQITRCRMDRRQRVLPGELPGKPRRDHRGIRIKHVAPEPIHHRRPQVGLPHDCPDDHGTVRPAPQGRCSAEPRLAGQIAEPRHLLAALAVARDPLQLGLALPTFGRFGCRSKFDRTIGTLQKQAVNRFRTRLVVLQAGGPPAARTPIRINVPCRESVDPKLPGVFRAEPAVEGVLLWQEEASHVRLGHDERGSAQIHRGHRPAGRQPQQVAADSAADFGQWLSGGKPPGLVTGNIEIGRLLNRLREKKHLLCVGELAGRAPAELDLLQRQMDPLRRKPAFQTLGQRREGARLPAQLGQ